MLSPVENQAAPLQLDELKALYDSFKISLQDIYKINNAYSHQFIQELVETREPGCRVLLDIAIRNNDDQLMQSILETKPAWLYNFVSALFDGEIPGSRLLHLAVKNNDEKLVQVILDKKPEYVWSFNDAKKSTLAVAAEAGFWNILERLHMVNMQVMSNPLLRTCSKKIAYSDLGEWFDWKNHIEWKIQAYRQENLQCEKEQPTYFFPPYHITAYEDILKAIPLKDMQERDLFLQIFSSMSSFIKNRYCDYLERTYSFQRSYLDHDELPLEKICKAAMDHVPNKLDLKDLQQVNFYMEIFKQYMECMLTIRYTVDKDSDICTTFKTIINSMEWKNLALINDFINHFFAIPRLNKPMGLYVLFLERGITTIDWNDESNVNFLMKQSLEPTIHSAVMNKSESVAMLQLLLDKAISSINWKNEKNIHFFMLHISRLIKFSTQYTKFDYKPAIRLALLAKSSKLIAMLDAADRGAKNYDIMHNYKEVYEEGVKISKANTALWAKPEDSRKPWIPALLIQAFSCKKSAFFEQPVVIYCILKFLAEGQIMDISDGLTIADNTDNFLMKKFPATQPIMRTANGRMMPRVQAMQCFLEEVSSEKSNAPGLIDNLGRIFKGSFFFNSKASKSVDEMILTFVRDEFEAGRFAETPIIKGLHNWGLINIDTYRYEYTAKATNLFHQEIKTIRKITPESSTLVENLLRIDNMDGKKNAYKHQYKNKYICQYLHKRAVDMKQDASSDTVRLLEKYFAWTPEKRQMFKPVQNIAQMCNEFAGYLNTSLESRVFIQELQGINQNFKLFNTGKTHTRVMEHIDSYLSGKKQQEVLGQPSKLLDVLKKYALVTDKYIQKFQNNKTEAINLTDFTLM